MIKVLKKIFNYLKSAALLLSLMLVVTGVFYPAVITAFAQVLFPWQANGSLLYLDKMPIGSQLLGQSFKDKKYFWGRPSETGLFPYNARSSSGSNFGPSNPSYLSKIQERVKVLKDAHPYSIEPIPVDLVTASGSGLDPEISLTAATYQVKRIAKARNVLEEDLKNLIKHHLKTRSLWIFGEPRINVLEINLALDQMNTPSRSNILDAKQ